MSEEENYTELDISDVVEDTEQYLETDYQSTNIIGSELSTVPDSEIFNSEDQVAEKNLVTHIVSKPEVLRSTKLPLARIKNIMKMDPDVSIVNAEAVFLVTKATELFLETIAKETYTYTAQQKRKTIAKKDLDVVINKVDCLCFLEGAMDF
ncbi:DNA polymerase epsilon subunit 4 [Bicyclus anynana]|uniref:DNA polymerase epsilon subunit 4 n=1 Tax=Bicyclus anynana TaxID=110368 RepID=A0A6J1N1Z0_BICAN|nr:DNA polymerase epsilon subunit 4 [Bicyclus anynana]